ncbi:MAG TPA: alpha/beta fold hydrolase [Thermoanaerobaculia bacterium]|jgi:pimeloyl-ACP methyl ester carboxylesterase
MSLTRRPLYFGPPERSLFGWYHAPADVPRSDLAIVICAPLGHEYVNSHRAMRHLADKLARAGVPALRFDYDGAGDSAGSDEEPERLAAWLASIEEAMRTLRELSGCERIGLAGLRFGATLAALVAAKQEVASLMLWAPPVRGRDYLRELRVLSMSANRNAPPPPGAIEPGGFLITAETQRELNEVNLTNVVPKAERVLIVGRDDFAEDTRLRDAWTAAGIPIEQRVLPGFAGMFVEPHNSVLPEEALKEIVGWIARGSSAPRVLGSSGGEDSRGAEEPRTRGAAVVDGVRETLIDYSGIFGILSEPLDGVRGRATILLPNAGSTHHAGPNRLYVFLARALSAAGFRVLRFDLPGLGDSVIDDGSRENHPYLPIPTPVLARVIEAVRSERPAESFVLGGLCSGAYASFHAARDLRDAPILETILINPLTFYFDEGMSLDASPAEQYRKWNWYMRSLRRMDRWKKLLRGQVKVGKIVRTIMRRFRDVAASHVPGGGESTSTSRDLGRDLRAIVGSGRKLTFVFSTFDPGHDLLMFNAGRAMKRLRKDRSVELWQIEGASHTFEAKQARDAMIAKLIAHLSARYAAS